MEAKEIYRIIEDFSQHEWRKFAKTGLELRNIEVEQEECRNKDDIIEQRFQMIMVWRRKKGRLATIECLKDLVANHRGLPVNRGSQSNQNNVASSYGEGLGNRAVPGNSVATRPRNDRDREEEIADTTVQVPTCDASAMPGSSLSHAYVKASRGAELPAPNEESLIPRDSRFEYEPNTKAFTRPNSVGKQGANNIICYCDPVVSCDVPSCSKEDISNQFVATSYRFKPQLKGLVLIINIMFEGERTRTGSEKDAENLQKLWRNLQCKVIYEKDLTAKQISEFLEEVKESKDMPLCNFVAIFAMSHGGEDYLLGIDNEKVYIKDLLAQFNNVTSVRYRNIPKLFFFQSCRGEVLDSGVDVPERSQENSLSWLTEITDSPNPNNLVVADGDGSNLPVYSDMLISYATQPGHKAIRSPQDGSWFINAIVNVFGKQARKHHVADMMTRVNNAVSQKSGTDEEGNRCKAMSEYRNLLRKDLFLMPGYGSSI